MLWMQRTHTNKRWPSNTDYRRGCLGTLLSNEFKSYDNNERAYRDTKCIESFIRRSMQHAVDMGPTVYLCPQAAHVPWDMGMGHECPQALRFEGSG
jgi:hypothetical protein